MQPINVEHLAAMLDEFLWPERDPKLRRKRERILSAATELFVKLGYRKTTVDEIARRAGVAKGTVYLYYRNKAEIVLHSLGREKRAHIGRISPLYDTSLSPRDSLAQFLAIAIVMSAEMPLTTSLMQGDHEITIAMQEMDADVLGEVTGLQMQFIVQLLEAASGHECSPEELTKRGQVLMDMVFAVFTNPRIYSQDMPLSEYAAHFANAIINGIVNDVPGIEGLVTSPENAGGVQAEKRTLWGV